MYDYVESLYVGKSDRFFDGILGGGIAKTIMTGGESAVILGFMDNGTGKHQSNTVYSADGLSPAITTIEGGCNIMIENPLKGLSDNGWHFEQNVYSENSLVRTLKSVEGSGNIPKVIQGVNKLGNIYRDNYVLEQNPISTKGKKLDVAKTILSGYERSNMTGFNDDNAVFTNYQIRKLTPKECFRLMGVRDNDYDKLTVSNTQRYKQAGNSIVVDVLMAIFENMFIKDCKSNKLF